jgi:hypothetical protein
LEREQEQLDLQDGKYKSSIASTSNHPFLLNDYLFEISLMQNPYQESSERALRNLWEVKYCCPFDHDDGMGLVGCDGAGCVVWQHQLCCYPDADEAFLRATQHFCESCKEKRSQESQQIDKKEGYNLALPIRDKEAASNPMKVDTSHHEAQVLLLAFD